MVEDLIVSGVHAIAIKADISNVSQVKKMFHDIGKKFGKLDYLVNNAGIDVMQDFEDFDEDVWKRIIDINLTGKFLCSKYAVDLLKKSQNPKIINIASRL